MSGTRGLCTRDTVFPSSITLRSNNIPYINILQTAKHSYLPHGGRINFLSDKVLDIIEIMNVLSELMIDNIVSGGERLSDVF